MAGRQYEYGKLFQPSSGGMLIERKARRSLSHCLHKLGLSEVPLPVPVDRWIETAFDIRFGIADLSHIGPRVLGASFLRDREILVSEQALLNEGRYRFTCAHELAHFVLHMHVRDRFVSKTATLIRAHSLQLIGAEPRTLIPSRLFYDLMPKPAPSVATPPAGGR